ncbi:MAG: tryptophan synthase subunit alpha [Solirubrobacterales bacterium]|nr:tryptophan synthase subunit alpha [Solirubrobacterales bacterium]
MSAGSDRIKAAFETAREEGRAALMPYMMGGFPDVETSKAIARSYADNGADLIELGVPFSDPLADGPVIHAAATQALDAGTKLDDVLAICREVSDRIPVVLMVYTNTILGGQGTAAFAARAVAAGAAGVIVPDLPLGEDESVRSELTEAGLAVVPLVAPTTLGERRAEICRIAGGFVYVVSSVGTTGERSEVPTHLQELVEDVESKSEVPVAVGFGIGSPDHAATVGRIADGVIIGSKLVRIAADAAPGEAPQAVGEFMAETAAALASARPSVR